MAQDNGRLLQSVRPDGVAPMDRRFRSIPVHCIAIAAKSLADASKSWQAAQRLAQLQFAHWELRQPWPANRRGTATAATPTQVQQYKGHTSADSADKL